MRSANSSRILSLWRAAELGVAERGHRVAGRLLSDRLADAVVLARADRHPHGRSGRTGRAVDRRPHRLLEHLPRAVAARAVEQEVADVLERDHVVGDDPRVDVGDLVLPAQEQAVQLERPDPALLDRLEDHVHPEQVGRPPDDHAEDRQQPPPLREVGDDRDRDPEQEAEQEAEVDHQPQLVLADVPEDPVDQRRVPLEVIDDHQLQVEQLVDVEADVVGDLADDLGELLLDARVDRLPGSRRARPATGRGARAASSGRRSRGSPGSNIVTMCSAILSGSSCW